MHAATTTRPLRMQPADKTSASLSAPVKRPSGVACRVAQQEKTYVINEIPNNGVWTNGIPPVMGAHLMASGVVAPLSVSKGAGKDVYPPKVAYFGAEGNVQTLLHATAAQAGQTLAKLVAEASEAAIAAKGSFTLVLSGGALIDTLSVLVGYKATTIQWDKFHVFFVDERNVAHSSDQSNVGAASKALLSQVPIPKAQVYAIAEGLTVREAAINYEGRLVALPASVLPRNASGLPVFDLMLLGVGPDGHIASLFPHRSTLDMNASSWVFPVDNSPKPPAERITLSLPVINASKEIVFVALGESKAEIVQRTLEVQALPGSLPAQLVQLSNGGKVKWLLDVQSAQFLNIAEWDNGKLWNRSTFPKEEKA